MIVAASVHSNQMSKVRKLQSSYLIQKFFYDLKFVHLVDKSLCFTVLLLEKCHFMISKYKALKKIVDIINFRKKLTLALNLLCSNLCCKQWREHVPITDIIRYVY